MTRKAEIQKILPSLNGMIWRDADSLLYQKCRAELHKRDMTDQLDVMIAVGDDGYWRKTGLKMTLAIEKGGMHRVYTPHGRGHYMAREYYKPLT